VENSTNAGANARVILNGFTENSPMPAAEPLFKATPYGAGNPRFVIETGQSAFYFDYPAGSSGCGVNGCWFLNTASNTSLSYAQAKAAIDAQGGVNEAWIVADSGGQGAGLPYTTNVTDFSWSGQTLIPAPDTVTVTTPANQTSPDNAAITSVQVHASSDVGSPITSYGAAGLPHGVTINTTTGLISGTPDTPGTSTATVTATDARGTSGASAGFTWVVQAATVTPPPPTFSNVVTIRNRHSGLCLNEGNGVLSQFACSAASTFPSLRWQVETISGVHYLISAAHGEGTAAGMFVQDGTQGQQLRLVTPESPVSLLNGGFFKFPNSLVMDDKGQSLASGAAVIGWPQNGGNNQRWDFQFFAKA
jgi:hypothetical protein